ncbi:chemotaxis protein CheW [Occallatibacter savannae]|uniref:chemotaxis protein CheW n=1 Tax=Occallatibacter savannae TaxID=1002691 RepID=UPI000D68F86D|nr:chemotaxis protein CheW [Occallatibacter savannae]
MQEKVVNSEYAGELLVCTFALGENGVFGIDATLVQEVAMMGELTPVRHAPAFVAGIRNLRGRIITVIDLCERLGLGVVRATPETRLLIADWNGEPVGLLVDRVEGTLAMEAGALQRAPSNISNVQSEKLRGVFRTGHGLAGLLHLPSVLDGNSGSDTSLAE